MHGHYLLLSLVPVGWANSVSIFFILFLVSNDRMYTDIIFLSNHFLVHRKLSTEHEVTWAGI